ncbi:MAG: radical SAM protein [Candidatus Nanoarchaeia archaeon]
MAKYPILNKNLTKNYTVYDFQDNWDKDSIKEAIISSKGKLPSFCLSRIEIHPSGTCNQNCKTCYGKFLAPKKKLNLSAKYVNSLLSDIRKNLPNENPLIMLSGLYSEPLINPEIKEILKYLGKYKFRFGLYTNGLLMNDEIIEILVKNSLNIEYGSSFVSFNIASSIFSGDFEKLIKIIKKLSAKKSNLQINAPFLVLNPDYEYIKEIVEKLINAGVSVIKLSIPWPQFVYNKSEDTPLNKNNKKILETIEKIHKEFPNKIKVRYPHPKESAHKCYVMAMAATISSEGKVYTCPETCSPFFKQLSYGDIKKNKFSKIWQGPKHQKVFKNFNLKNKKCKCCPVNAMFNEFCEKVSK